MNIIDFEFYQIIKKLELLNKDDIYSNIKNKYLSLSNELKNNIENFINNFDFWGKLDYKNNNYEEIINRCNFLKDNTNNLIILYQKLNDYKSKKILLSIIKNLYLYDFNLLNEVRETNYKHYFDLDLIKPNKDTIFVDVGAFNGDTTDEYLNSFLENYKKIYCYEITPSNISILKDKYILNKDIIIKHKALLNKNTKVSINNNKDSSANKISLSEGNIECVRLDDDIKEKIDIIKMDIEGSELLALEGSKKHIIKDKPILLISIYHGFEDIIKIPLFINKLNPKYKFYLRYYGGNIFPTEIVLICT